MREMGKGGVVVSLEIAELAEKTESRKVRKVRVTV
jgi:hypothetical protein